MPTTTTISGCPCCASCDCSCATPGIWSAYTFTVSGITGPGGATTCQDGTGTDGCDLLNGNWTITRRTGCNWDSGDASPCDPGEPTWTLGCNGTNWVLSTPCVAGSTANTWSLAVASWDGNSAGTFSLSSGDQCCTPLPSTITLTPAGSFLPCPTCCGITTDCLNLTFATPFGGTYGCLNGTSVLLTWDGSAWSYSGTTCAGPTTVVLTCTDGTWSIDLEFTDDGCGGGAFVSVQCDPFELHFTFSNTCFFGVINMTVTTGEGCTPGCSSYPTSITCTPQSNCSPGIPDPLLVSGGGSTWTNGQPTSCGSGGWDLTLTCVDGVITYEILDGSTYTGPVTIISHIPFHAQLTYSPTTGSCCDGMTITIDLTE